MMKGRQRNQKKDEVKTNDYECLNPITKSVVISYQAIQTIGLLVLIAVYYWGPESWIATIMPALGTFAVVVIVLAINMFLWIKRIRVLDSAN